MNQHVRKALETGLTTYGHMAGHPAGALLDALTGIFESDQPFTEKMDRLDAAFDEHPRFDELREVAFDLLLMNFFAEDVNKLEADYLESPEWEAIEEETLDRGTEVLNLLLYLRECADEEIEPQLSDYLTEFLLVDEDEFQDEHRIYEPVIANQLLVDSIYAEIAKAAGSIPEEQELSNLFYPMMSFFNEPEPSEKDMAEFSRHSAQPAFDTAIYRMLVAYNAH